MKEGLDDKGLKMCLDKTEIIPTAPNHLVPLNAFSDFAVNPTGDFNFLGAPFGSKEYCTKHTQKRVSKAVKVLDLAAEMEDRQSALHIVRDCLSYCKISYATRMVPPRLHPSQGERSGHPQAQTGHSVR